MDFQLPLKLDFTKWSKLEMFFLGFSVAFFLGLISKLAIGIAAIGISIYVLLKWQFNKRKLKRESKNG